MWFVSGVWACFCVLAAKFCQVRAPPNAATLAGFANPRRGWERLYVDHVRQADTGADLDFLIGASGSVVTRESH